MKKIMKDKFMNEINYKYIALGILIGYLSPYIFALIKSYSQQKSPEQKEALAYEY